MSDNQDSNRLLSGTQSTDIVNAPILGSRKDLAAFLGITHKRLAFILYHRDRAASYREITIPKSSGEPRQLHAVSGHLKWLQREALDRFQETWPPTAYSHGFTPERSIVTNASFHQRKKVVIRVDLENFFPSITFPRVQGMFRSPPFHFGNEAATTMAQMACLDTGTECIPQGGVLSPYISNMMCRRMDKRLALLAREHCCHFTRYADDITFSTNNTKKLDLNLLVDKIRQIIESEHFRVNEAKTRVMTPKDRQVVTGIIVNDGLNVNRRYFRSIRATIYNCEQHGVQGQVVKQGGFKDQRNSRPRQLGSQEGCAIQGTSDRASEFFLRHLLGKIEFVGQVVLSEEQKGNPATLQRVRLYEKLLYRFYKLVKSELSKHFKQSQNSREPEKIRSYKKIEEMVRKRIAKRPRISGQLINRDERESVKQEALKKYQDSAAAQQKLGELAEAKNAEDIRQLVKVLGKNDPRFFNQKLSANVQSARQWIAGLLEFPALDREMIFHFLDSFKDSHNGMGAFVHKTSDFTAEKGYKILNDQYYPVFYSLPIGLKKMVEDFIERFDDLAIQVEAKESIDIMHDNRISDAAICLKQGTRFGRVSAGGATNLKVVLEAGVKYAREECPDRMDVRLTIGKADSTRFYTHVASVKRATALLLHSMLENTKGDCVDIQAGLDPDDENIFLLMISDNSTGQLAGSASRDFVSGKLTHVVGLLNGLCDYHIEADFEVGGRVCLDMHNGEIIEGKPRQEAGVAHLLRFRRK